MTDYLSKLKMLDQEIADPVIHKQVAEIKQIIKAVSRQEVLPLAPAKLGLLPDQEAAIGQASGQYKKVKAINHLLNSLRQYLSLRYGIWSLPNAKAAFLIKHKLKVQNALEIMAGNAYWTKALKKIGIQATATDSSEWAKTSATGRQKMTPLKNLSAQAAIKAFPQADLVLCSWAPNFGHADIKAVEAWHHYNPHSHLLFIAEKGVTNSDLFWQQVVFKNSRIIRQLNAAFKSFDFIDEKFFEVKS